MLKDTSVKNSIKVRDSLPLVDADAIVRAIYELF
jgi:hypothetical protein